MIKPKRNFSIAFPYAKIKYNKKYDSGNSNFSFSYKKGETQYKIIQVVNLERPDVQEIMCP